MSSHDRWLANYGISPATVYCANPTCGYHDGTEVTYVSEYGQGWYEPEDCPSCGGEWLDEQPEPGVPFDPELSDDENAL